MHHIHGRVEDFFGLIGKKVAISVVEFGLLDALLNLEVLDHLLGLELLHLAPSVVEVSTASLEGRVVDLFVRVNVVIALHLCQASRV